MSLLALVASASHAAAQFGPWAEDQISTSICLWYQPRGQFAVFSKATVIWFILTLVAAFVRDTVYIDGGSIWWQPGMKDGSKGDLMNEGKSWLFECCVSSALT